ncbi:hypothetical protein HCB17_19915 [Salinispora arenicola]|uniref:Uncharacterized protein n=1 Tax=Salinispora arenicola (strain CNS-205) TaxID=391037 RepID=A8M3Y4_SALAI|nr:hypothetical protein [Salinispora arenicola]MCN0181144.1 hypothetical protein [Salinispora arenicola]NIL43149.1 hypothetical protein [Salinispora arenicola]
MTDQHRFDLADTDEPDGTTAMEASLRPPGESLPTEDVGDDFADLPAEDRRSAREISRAGYDVADVSGAVDPNRE